MPKLEETAKLLKTQRTRCFFDIDFNGHSVGRVIFELYNDLCPKTCENFRALCTGLISKLKRKKLTSFLLIV